MDQADLTGGAGSEDGPPPPSGPGAGSEVPAVSIYFKILCGVLGFMLFMNWFVQPFLDYVRSKLTSKAKVAADKEELRKKRGNL